MQQVSLQTSSYLCQAPSLAGLAGSRAVVPQAVHRVEHHERPMVAAQLTSAHSLMYASVFQCCARVLMTRWQGDALSQRFWEQLLLFIGQVQPQAVPASQVILNVLSDWLFAAVLGLDGVVQLVLLRLNAFAVSGTAILLEYVCCST